MKILYKSKCQYLYSMKKANLLHKIKYLMYVPGRGICLPASVRDGEFRHLPNTGRGTAFSGPLNWCT